MFSLFDIVFKLFKTDQKFIYCCHVYVVCKMQEVVVKIKSWDYTLISLSSKWIENFPIHY